MQAAVGSSPQELVRSKVLWCLGQIPVSLFNDPHIWGKNFVVKFRSQNLYLGRLDNRNRPLIALETTNNNQTLNTSSEVGLISRSLEARGSNPTTITIPLNIPGFENTHLKVDFNLTGATLRKAGIFESILGALLTIALSVYYEAMASFYIAYPSLPVWIYILYNDVPQVPNPLRVYQVIAVLQAVAKYCVARHIYQELLFNVFVDGKLLAGGCVVKADGAREWCAGLI